MNVLEDHCIDNADMYCTMLKSFKEAVRRKPSGILSDGVILLHDNAQLHTHRQEREKGREQSRVDLEFAANFRWETFNHYLYSLPVAANICHVSSRLEGALCQGVISPAVKMSDTLLSRG